MAIRSVGTVLQKGPTASAIDIGEITSIGGLEMSAETIDTTNLSSSGGYREFIAGFKDAGEVSVEGYFNPGDAGQAALWTAFQSGATDEYAIVFPTGGGSWTFDGVITGFSTSADLEEAISFEATIKVSGAPTLVLPV